MPNQVHQISRVLTFVYGESGSDPDLVGIFAQKPSADTVERSGPGQRFGHNAGAAAHNLSCDALHAPGHLGRGAARKGHQQDPAGIGPIRWATRWATVLVFPEPAPAMTRRAVPGTAFFFRTPCSTARRCSRLRVSR